ncbi:lipoprotein lipase [Platysternon megacephalum]|uniref:Lipoprotein lipase n=1 Tax=Platysternon megacephalum TaxID=55544 RepID=A0A4D9E435_9SAUR|nr:lipoprotein lipase [Platysternon megacephalum]
MSVRARTCVCKAQSVRASALEPARLAAPPAGASDMGRLNSTHLTWQRFALWLAPDLVPLPAARHLSSSRLSAAGETPTDVWGGEGVFWGSHTSLSNLPAELLPALSGAERNRGCLSELPPA